MRAAHSEVSPLHGDWGGGRAALWNCHILGPETNLHPRYPLWRLFLKTLKILSLNIGLLRSRATVN